MNKQEVTDLMSATKRNFSNFKEIELAMKKVFDTIEGGICKVRFVKFDGGEFSFEYEIVNYVRGHDSTGIAKLFSETCIDLKFFSGSMEFRAFTYTFKKDHPDFLFIQSKIDRRKQIEEDVKNVGIESVRDMHQTHSGSDLTESGYRITATFSFSDFDVEYAYSFASEKFSIEICHDVGHSQDCYSHGETREEIDITKDLSELTTLLNCLKAEIEYGNSAIERIKLRQRVKP